MSQINVNPPSDGGSDRTSAAGINMISVILVLAVILFLVWLFLAGPGRSVFNGGAAAPSNAPAQQAPGTTGGTNGGASGGISGGASGGVSGGNAGGSAGGAAGGSVGGQTGGGGPAPKAP